MVESQRLHFIRGKQSELRSETYESLRNLKTAGNSDASTSGQHVILPSSFTGGSRYMMQNYLDAMCLCRCYGYPDFFLTITCNPGWPEVKRFLKDTNLNSEDRPDILCRIFKMKLDSMIKLMKDKALFGKIKAAVYTIEFQKRGLPHAHICLFIAPENKIHNPSHIDNFISSEIPDKVTEPDLYQLVSDHMLHVPCGEANPSCSCMIDRECSKNFPKRFQNETSIDSNGFPLYKRRDNGRYVVNKGINLDNRSFVPYNKILLRKYQAHINVEWCNQEGSIKYLFKYINKGPYRTTISLVQNNTDDNEDPQVDEIKAFYDCRYFSACEAAWRIFAFDVHYRVPAVTRLPFHLPGQQQIIYGPEEDIDDVLAKTSNLVSMFTGWMEANRNYEHARRLSYAEFPTQFVWKKNITTKMGRKAKDSCYRRGLLDDDKEYLEAIEEASHTANKYYLRNLFATMLITSSLSRPDYVWDNTWQFLVDEILYHQQKIHKNPGLSLSDDQLKNLALLQIEDFLVSNNSSLRGVFFVYGYGGTGKTYLWKTLSASIRSKGEIVLNVASSGIASLLLEGGRTAYSRFLIPINLTEDSQCQVKGNTDVSELLKKTSLIIWDEAPMIHKHAFEALDRTLKDVMNVDLGNTYGSLFGGKVVVLGGDFRQILPVVQNGTRNDCVNAIISSSYIWPNCKVLKLTKNMRLTVGSQISNTLEIKQFTDWLLDIGQGNLGGPNDGEATITIPEDLLIKDSLDPMSDLIDFVYPSMLDRFNDLTYFQERALLAPLNGVVQEINDRILAYFPGQEMEYLSSESIDEVESVSEDFDPALYSPDFLNGIKMSGIPNHRLLLKVGIPIMLLRNINQKKGLCNGTRLQVVSLGKRVIEAKVVSGTNIGFRTLLSRISLTSSDKKLPFKLKRRQFPISVCFAMTINKSQGQSLSRVGLYLKDPVFTHGQLYVALSRVKTREGIKIVLLDKESKLISETKNVVYKEIFGNLI
ncbi:uncharacterized protein LOC143600366 [Bidens hawaiensis]|uniref:uncharacterized protein LOC143600366 n=1 Tax=Bidens hawaiensis TaxID=980011 RepID=UPI0040494C51